MKNWLVACGLVFVCGCGGSTNDGSSGGAAGASGSGGSGVGGSGTGGSSTGGSGGVIPSTGVADKVDVLVMVDNSISMADKQVVLAEALPGLVNALTAPPIDSGTGQPAFKPVTDIHFGVITSSIGGHGGDICSPGASFNETQNDKAHLISTVRPGLTSYDNQGFLWWDPTGAHGGESDPNALVANFESHIQAAGEHGCGYEASLESWYRFLIDPEPPLSVANVNQTTEQQGIDDALLQQRKDFLRPDSLVIIVLLSDENDCSMADEGQNWVFAQAQSGGGGAFHMPAGTSVCATDPNSVCCRSCAIAEAAPPDGCASLTADPACQNATLDDESDHINMRCWNQKQRFGITSLHPTRRYVDGLTKSLVPDRNGNMVENPLFLDPATGQISRAQNMVMFVPIVGVPWQDVATSDSLTGSGLTYLTAAEIANQGRWSWLLPACKTAGADGVCDEWDLSDQADDPFMIESQTPRSGVNPATNAAVAPPSSGPGANPINGHEFNNPGYGDLQYACTFELAEPRDCATLLGGVGCDCSPDPDPSMIQSPLCQASDGSYSSVQRHAKAYPGTRQLQVAKDLGANAVVGSACPKSVGATSPAHAYIPVVDAVARQLVGRLVK